MKRHPEDIFSDKYLVYYKGRFPGVGTLFSRDLVHFADLSDLINDFE
jgi:hypothetical protein